MGFGDWGVGGFITLNPCGPRYVVAPFEAPFCHDFAVPKNAAKTGEVPYLRRFCGAYKSKKVLKTPKIRFLRLQLVVLLLGVQYNFS